MISPFSPRRSFDRTTIFGDRFSLGYDRHLQEGTTLWGNTIAAFRDRIGSSEPLPAAVCVSAVSASFGFGLLKKVLEILVLRTGSDIRRRTQLGQLIESTKNELTLVSHYADQDIAVFTEYLECRRSAKDTHQRSEEKARALDTAVRATIEVPLKTARSAVAGLELCCEANQFVHSFIAADLGAAATLFCAAVRATLLSVDFNLGLLNLDPQFCRDILTEKEELQIRARRLSALLFVQIEEQVSHPSS